MAYENFENSIIESFGRDIESGLVNPNIQDLEETKAKRKYQEYIEKVIKLRPREFFIESIPEAPNQQEFFKIAYYLVFKIFGKEFIPEFTDLVRDKLYIANSREILEGISLQLISKDNPNEIKQAIEIPDFIHISSIISLLHEYTHYHCQLMKMDYNQKRYYQEILSIYVEKRATEELAEILANPKLKQMILETRLESIAWHYNTHPQEVVSLLLTVAELERVARVNPFAKMQLQHYKDNIPWLKDEKTIRVAEQHRENLQASYGIGYLYSESLLAKYKDDERRTNAKVASTLKGDLKLQELLNYFGINASNDETYENVDRNLEEIKRNR